MTINEIKETKEVIVKTEYVAEDGKIFRDEEQCKKYEESAMFAIAKQLKKIADITEYDLYEAGSDENEVEVFDIQTPEDLILLKRYLYLKLTANGVEEKNFKDCFESTENRKGYSFDGVTYGHEVIVNWTYDKDWFWIYNDGSIEGFVKNIRDRVTKRIFPPKTTE